ncbi:hypothetical protein JCM6882_009387 [Rhodosporidiobolus microsporus]
MSDAATAAAQAAALETMKRTAADKLIGPVLIGALIGCCMCGGVLALATLYATRFPRDRWPFKALVGFLAVFTVYDTAVESYRWAIGGFTDLAVLGDITPVYFSLSAMNIGITVFFVQSFFIWRVWVISSRKAVVLCALQAALMLLAVSTVMVVSAKGYTSATNEEISVFRPIAILRLAAGVSADCLITGSLTYYIILKPRTAGAQPIYSSALQRIVAQAFTTNLVAGMVQITVLILLAADKSSTRFTIPSFMEVKTMVACLLITLISRPVTASGFSGGQDSSNPTRSGNGGGFLSNLGGTNKSSRSRANRDGLTSVRVDIEHHVDVDVDGDRAGGDDISSGFGSPGARSDAAAYGEKAQPYRVTFGGRDEERSLSEKREVREEDLELKEFN